MPRRKRSIVCAGGLQSPKLLMLSGVGPADHLRQHGIPVAVDSPQHRRQPPRSSAGAAGVLDQGEDAAARRHRPRRHHLHASSDPSLNGPDIQMFGRQNAPNVKDLKPDEGYLTMPGLMKPKSRGTVRLTSADPMAPLAGRSRTTLPSRPTSTPMRPASSSPSRLATAKASTACARSRSASRGAKKAEIVDYVRANAATYFHFVGTCAMGRDATAPVDEALARARRRRGCASPTPRSCRRSPASTPTGRRSRSPSGRPRSCWRPVRSLRRRRDSARITAVRSCRAGTTMRPLAALRGGPFICDARAGLADAALSGVAFSQRARTKPAHTGGTHDRFRDTGARGAP